MLRGCIYTAFEEQKWVDEGAPADKGGRKMQEGGWSPPPSQHLPLPARPRPPNPPSGEPLEMMLKGVETLNRQM